MSSKKKEPCPFFMLKASRHEVFRSAASFRVIDIVAKEEPFYSVELLLSKPISAETAGIFVSPAGVSLSVNPNL